MRIPLSKIDATPAAGGLMAVRIKATTGTEYETLLTPVQAEAFAELIERVRAGWSEAPKVEGPPVAEQPR